MSNEIPKETPRTLSRGLLYCTRALRLLCPCCGTRPLFPPLRSTRRFYDWFQPLDGCPRCGFPYEREPGYFLMATWAFSYTAGCLFGMLVFGLLTLTPLSIAWQVFLPCLSVFVFCSLTARHARALFLAFDRFFDPDSDRTENDPPFEGR
ncbi:MAG: hypothetical protein SFY92_12495 [Verrucomicrobiae bacterium]|nr:hypothetical protein [Verrucomicrobiae bacterium]